MASESELAIRFRGLKAARDAIGPGSFHVKLLMLCGVAMAADAVEVMAVSFILPPAGDDLSLSGPDKGWLSSMIFVGMMVGSWVWGSLADKFGRNWCLSLALLVNGLFGLASAFAPNFAVLLVCRFLSGFGVGGSIPIVFAYFSEFLPTSLKESYLIYLAMFWMVGSLFAAGFAWALIPNVSRGWRVFLAVSAAPSLVSAIFLFYSHESPGYYLSIGETKRCAVVLAAVSKSNATSSCPPFVSRSSARALTEHEILALLVAGGETNNAHAPPSSFHKDGESPPRTPDTPDHDVEHQSLLGKGVRSHSSEPIVQSESQIIQPPQQEEPQEQSRSLGPSSTAPSVNIADADDIHGDMGDGEAGRWVDDNPDGVVDNRKRIRVSSSHIDDSGSGSGSLSTSRHSRSCCESCCNALGVMWVQFKDLFSKELRRRVVLLTVVWFTICFGLYGMTMWLPEYFSETNKGISIYYSSFLTAVATLPGNIASLYQVRYLGAAATLAMGMLLSGVSVFFFLMCKTATDYMTVSCVFSAVSIGAWNALNIVSTNHFLPAVRSSAFGYLATVGRFGAICGMQMFGLFLKSTPAVPLILVTSALVCGSVASLCLPRITVEDDDSEQGTAHI